MRLVIIGNGIAAYSAAESFRKYNADSEVVMLSQESYLTYYRIKLSHFLGKAGFTDDSLLLKSDAWYREKQIDLRLGSLVTGIDFEMKQVHIDGQESLDYDQLLIATGANPFIPPVKGSDLEGVFALRTLDHLKAIHTYVSDKQNVVIIGGGLLGLEAAQGLVELGKQVHVIETFPYLLNRQLDQELSKVVQKQLEAEGISFVLGIGCEQIVGDGHVTGIQFADGSVVPTDAVIFSAGVRPNLDLVKGSPLVVNRGVVVDARMRTNLPDVYAAGDIAEYEGVVFGLWTAANEHGKIAGSNLAGVDMTYAAPQMVASLNIGEVKLFSAGDVAEPERVITFKEGKAFHRLFVKGGCVVGAVLTGDVSLMLKAKNLVLNKPAVGENEERFEEIMK